MFQSTGGGSQGRWAGGPVTRWPECPVAQWAGGLVGRWPAWWPSGPVARWAGGPMVRWPAEGIYSSLVTIYMCNVYIHMYSLKLVTCACEHSRLSRIPKHTMQGVVLEKEKHDA